MENITDSNVIAVKNIYSSDFTENIVYVSSSEKINSYTGSKNSFIGGGNLENPESINKIELDSEIGLGEEACICVQINITLEKFQSKEICFTLGSEDNILDIKNIAYKYSKVSNAKEELALVKRYWEDVLSTVYVKTPLESTNIILNSWAVYQTIACRLLAKSGFYQSGGAIGFRDQLQDTLGLKFIDSEYLRNQILKHARHQFIEGDVQHWWHDETKRGIRTRFSDDLLWLPYAVCEYIEFTDDMSILEEIESYVEGEVLPEGVDEKYNVHKESDIEENILMHCIRALDKGINLGENNLPKIGSGDWNDGMNTLGNKGIGESVWLGFFLYNILDRFIAILGDSLSPRGHPSAVKLYYEAKKSVPQMGRERLSPNCRT